jgi:hypothetical protein
LVDSCRFFGLFSKISENLQDSAEIDVSFFTGQYIGKAINKLFIFSGID